MMCSPLMPTRFSPPAVNVGFTRVAVRGPSSGGDPLHWEGAGLAARLPTLSRGEVRAGDNPRFWDNRCGGLKVDTGFPVSALRLGAFKFRQDTLFYRSSVMGCSRIDYETRDTAGLSCNKADGVSFGGPKKHALERDLAEAQRKLSRLERLVSRAEAPAYEPDEFCPHDCGAPETAFRTGWLQAMRSVREIIFRGDVTRG